MLDIMLDQCGVCGLGIAKYYENGGPTFRVPTADPFEILDLRGSAEQAVAHMNAAAREIREAEKLLDINAIHEGVHISLRREHNRSDEMTAEGDAALLVALLVGSRANNDRITFDFRTDYEARSVINWLIRGIFDRIGWNGTPEAPSWKQATLERFGAEEAQTCRQ